MRLSGAAVLLAGVLCGQSGEPTAAEIRQAYQSKRGEHATIIPGLRWETWTIKDVRGWKLKFKRVDEQRGIGMVTRRYQAIAKKGGACAEYMIVHPIVLQPRPQAPARLDVRVEAIGLKPCL